MCARPPPPLHRPRVTRRWRTCAEGGELPSRLVRVRQVSISLALRATTRCEALAAAPDDLSLWLVMHGLWSPAGGSVHLSDDEDDEQLQQPRAAHGGTARTGRKEHPATAVINVPEAGPTGGEHDAEVNWRTGT